MDPQAIIDTATAVNAAVLGTPEATSAFRAAMRNSFRVTVALKPQQREQLKSWVDFPVVFVPSKNVTNDHPVLVALRDLARDVYEQEFHVSTTALRSLVVGAAAREMRLYNANPHVHYYVHGSEGKDHTRVVLKMLEAVAKGLQKKAAKTDRRVFIDPYSPTKYRGPAKRYSEMRTLIRDFVEVEKMPGNVHLEPVEAEVLLLEDSCYNLDRKGWLDLFTATGASTARGYCLLPYELGFDEMPANNLYRIRKEAGTATVTFSGGYCNGYSHSLDAWATILRDMVIAGPDFSILFEITARVGPYAVFQAVRTTKRELVVREIELPESMTYVQLLDLYASVDMKSCVISKPLKYFPAYASEYYDTLNYALDLKDTALTLQNVMTFVRRRMGGMSLATKELLAPWHLPRADVYRFCLAVYLQAKVMVEKTERMLERNAPTDVWARIKRVAWRVVDFATMPFFLLKDLYALVFAENLVGQIVRFPPCAVYQKAVVKRSESRMKCFLATDFPDESDMPDCSICRMLHGRLGEQQLKCEHRDYVHEFALSEKQVRDLHTQLIDDDNDAGGLAKVKKDAAEKMPKAAFSHKCRVHYLRGGPGTGKSYIIRQLADSHDLVYVPFTKLKPDYEFLEDVETGERYDVPFATTHRGYRTTGHRRIFVDEFTSLGYEHIAIVAYLNQAEDIFLVGDDRQTRVSEPDEGLYVGNYVPLDRVGTHTLLVNFRNPRDIVAKLNETYGYEMRAVSTQERSVEFVSPADVPSGVALTRMAFSKATARTEFGEEKMTVRANQGGTAVRAALYCTAADSTQHMASELQIVGISRHREKLYIALDDSTQAATLKEQLGFTDDFYLHMQQFLTFVDTDNVATLAAADPAVDEVLREQHPPSDAYLLADTLLPPLATDPDVTSINHAASHVVGDDFRSGVLDVDSVVAPVNARGNPKTVVRGYRSIGAGMGLHFTTAQPTQTLQVLQDRYLGKVAKYNYSRDAELAALAIGTSFVAEHMDLAQPWDEWEIDSVVKDFLRAAAAKHYDTQYRGQDAPDTRVVRFHLKGIFKPKLIGLDPYKVGQGISAWSKEAQSMFGACFRIINRRFQKCLRSHVVYDNGMSESQFLREVAEQFDKVPYVALNGVTDGEKYDSKQNRFTQEIERVVLRRLGISDDFLELYYSFRNDYVIQADGVRGRAGSEKTSGEPGTLLLNTILAAATSNFVLRGDGPVAMVVKGDDGCKRQCNLRADSAAAATIARFAPLVIKVSISDRAEFCGFTVVQKTMAPNIVRKLSKLVGHRFKDYDHFCEYQASLREYVKLVEWMGRAPTIAVNADLYGSTYAEVEAAWDCVVSFAHINELQFLQKFDWREEGWLIPSRTCGGLKVVQ